jgi:type I restriction enzyme S subunit
VIGLAAQASELPDGWDVASFGELNSFSGGTVNPALRPDEVFDLYSVPSFPTGHPEQLPGRAIGSTKQTVSPGDVLVCKINPRINRVWEVGPLGDREQIASSEWIGFRSDAVVPRFAKHYFTEPSFRSLLCSEVSGVGGSLTRAQPSRVATYPVPVAPLAEQTRIADQLDTLLARIQACQDRLEAIPALLKRFRQAVLRAATSGELTRDERSRFDWSSDWTPMPLTALGELARGKSKHRPRDDPRLYGGPYPFVQTGDVAQSGGLIIQHRQTYSELGLQQSRLWPAGTLCITIAANIADTALLAYPACFPDSVVGFIANPNKCEALFVKWSIDVVKDDIEALAPATAQKNINLSVLNEVVIRTPDLAEQREIVRRGKALLAIADRIEARYVNALRHSQRLAPLTLAKAFRGELVPQDPNDEPASALLARIAAQRNAPASIAVASTPRRGRPPRAPKESAPMTKSRQDDDVMGQPYLAGLLRRVGTPSSAEALFKVAELPVADFYKQLAWEVDQGHVTDNQTTLEPGHAAG